MTHPWERAIEFGMSLCGAPYSRWQSGALCDDTAPAWSVSPSTPLLRDRIGEVLKHGASCAGLVNLMLREVRATIPQNPPWNGGTEAYGLHFGLGHDSLEKRLHPFSLSEVRRGDAVFRPYDSVVDQGHVAIALGGADDRVLQSFANSPEVTTPGVNCDFTLRESHDGWYYTFIIRREDLWDTIDEETPADAESPHSSSSSSGSVSQH